MAFVNELIPEEEKEQFQDITIWKDAMSGGKISTYMWTIDRERNLFLIRRGGGGGRKEIPDFFALSWHGEIIKFQAFKTKHEGDFSTGIVLSWEIDGVDIPPNLVDKQVEIYALIVEAMDAYGLTFKRDVVKKVHVEFVRGARLWK